MVTVHGKLRMFFLDNKVIQCLLLGKFITESQAVVEQTETDNDGTVIHGLIQVDCQFVIVIADFFFFSPHRLPGFIEGSRLGVLYFETVI